MAPVAPAVGGHKYPSPVKAWGLVALLAVMSIVSFVDRFVLALLIEPLKAELHLSDTQVGLLIGTVFAAVYVVIGVPLARAADVWRRRDLIILGAVIWTITTTASAFTTGFAMLMILRMGVAVGEAVLSPAAISMIGDMFPREKRLVASAVFISVGSGGANLAMMLGAAVLDFASSSAGQALPVIGHMSPWRITLVLVGLPGLLLAMLLFLFKEPARVEAKAEPPPLSAVVDFIKANKRTYIGHFGLSVLTPLTVISLMTWYPTFLIRGYGMPAAEAGFWFGLVGAIGLVAGALLGPVIASALSSEGHLDAQMIVSAGCVIIGAPLVGLSVMTPSPVISLIVMGPGFACMCAVGGLMGASCSTLAPGRLRAVMMALTTLSQSGAGMLFGPLIVATLSQYVFHGPRGVGHAIALQLAITAPIALVLALATRKPFAQSIRDARAREEAETAAREAVPA